MSRPSLRLPLQTEGLQLIASSWHMQLCRLAATMSKRYNARMNHELKITKIGNSAGVVLPKDVLAHLDTAIGQTLSVTKTPHGIELRAPSTDFEAQMDAARIVMARRKRALRELAK